MDFDAIENLNEDDIELLYSNSVEEGGMISTWYGVQYRSASTHLPCYHAATTGKCNTNSYYVMRHISSYQNAVYACSKLGTGWSFTGYATAAGSQGHTSTYAPCTIYHRVTITCKR